jgi:hypothetical protein
MPLNSTRRDFLRTSTAIAAAGATAGLAGCVGDLLGTGGADRRDAVETVRKWSPAPARHPDRSGRDSTGYYLYYRRPKTLAAVNDRIDNDLLRGSDRAFEEEFYPLQVPFQAVPFALNLGLQTQIVRYEHDPSEFAATLGADGFEARPDHREFSVYAQVGGGDDDATGSRVESIVAFDGTYLIRSLHVASANSDEPAWFETVIDTHAGVGERYVDTDEHVEAMLEIAQSGDVLNLSRNEARSADGDASGRSAFEGYVGQCLSGQFGDESIHYQLLYGFEETEDADVKAIREYVETQRDEGKGFHADAEGFEFERRGRFVEVQFSVPLNELY